jgi:hypothetical protein
MCSAEIQAVQLIGYLTVCVGGLLGFIWAIGVLIEARTAYFKAYKAVHYKQSLMNAKPIGSFDPFLKGRI